jgi:hypothetical protein
MIISTKTHFIDGNPLAGGLYIPILSNVKGIMSKFTAMDKQYVSSLLTLITS